MFEIPENLPLSLAPLAWVLGRWQGWGTLAGDDDEPDAIILQDIQAEVVGQQMRVVTSLYHGKVEGEIDWQMNAAAGLDLIEPGELFREETSYWRLATPLAVLPPEGEEPRELQVTSADTQGLATLWVGVSMGPRIRLTSDVIARDASAPQMTTVHRMFGLVGGELFWTSETSLDQGEPQVELSGRLRRASQEAEEA
ncbi:FABP family protein [Scrofimicrobium sp. R131]|uniref:Heme-binding beta-barrel domain-containing protein n=1 Tax=Scrofimicrobium appendicitidis TaxID=3079930 RepID=A0AAU7V6Y1_9ACTO